MQPDLDDLRIEERVTEEFMGAAPRAAAVSGVGLRRRPTFRVRLEPCTAASVACVPHTVQEVQEVFHHRYMK